MHIEEHLHARLRTRWKKDFASVLHLHPLTRIALSNIIIFAASSF